MNFKIPRWLHVVFMCVLALIGVITAAVAKGDLQIATPIMSVIAMVALIVHSIDPETAYKMAMKGTPTIGLAALVLACTGCPPSGAVVAPTIATAVCILTTVSADVAAGDTWQQCVSDTITKCGTDIATIATVWGAHEKALVAQGFVPPPIKGR